MHFAEWGDSRRINTVWQKIIPSIVQNEIPQSANRVVSGMGYRSGVAVRVVGAELLGRRLHQLHIFPVGSH
jgi:hypothetical protein